LHPVLGLGVELRNRGHPVTIATSEAYRSVVEGAAFSFRPIRPNLVTDRRRIAYLFDKRRGPERLIRDLMMPMVPGMYQDLLPLVENADVLVASELIYPAATISEITGVPWLSLITAPASFLSKYDPPVIPAAPFLHGLRRLGPWTHLMLNGLFRSGTWSWSKPLRRLRRELGLAPGRNPIFEAKHSLYGSLAIFSACLGSPQRDWPRSAIQTGFIFYDGAHHEPVGLRRYLDSSEPPIVFTLGSAAVHAAGDFYKVAFQAVQELRRRAIFLLGENAAPQTSADDFYFADYLPFSQVFPRAAAVVHQGGIGTCAQALRAGCPSLIVPFGFDQLDNAHRMCRLGVARSLPLARLGAGTMLKELEPLLAVSGYKEKVVKISRQILGENGVNAAANAVMSAGLSLPKPQFANRSA
jgi:UDP:flavonoid glycosyltransferase YjiC (YdhE family)